ncbi:MAG: hypothetical protein ACJ74U_20070 [Jatrophihabitantaceae bacterium]
MYLDAWLNDDTPPHPRRRLTDRWWYRLGRAVILLGTHAAAGWIGYDWPAVLVWIASNPK